MGKDGIQDALKGVEIQLKEYNKLKRRELSLKEAEFEILKKMAFGADNKEHKEDDLK